MAGEVNGLYPTPVRVRLLKAINEGHGRIYGEAGEAWDASTAWKVSARVDEFLKHNWVRALQWAEPRGPGEMPNPDPTRKPPRTYYRLTDFGRAAMKGQT